MEYMDPSIYKLLFRQQTLENDFSVVKVQSMQILCFDFLFTGSFHAIKGSQLRNVEQNLKSVVFPVLDRVETQI